MKQFLRTPTVQLRLTSGQDSPAQSQSRFPIDEDEIRRLLHGYLHDPANREAARAFLISEDSDDDAGPMDNLDAILDRLTVGIMAGDLAISEQPVRMTWPSGSGGTGSGLGLTGTAQEDSDSDAVEPEKLGRDGRDGSGGDGTGSDSGAAGSGQGTPLDTCRVSALTIERNTAPFTLTVAPGDVKQPVLQVVGGAARKPAKISCSAQMEGEACDRHAAGALTISPLRDASKPSGTTASLPVPAESFSEVLRSNWMAALWPGKIAPRTYTVQAQSCGEKLSARVQAFPDLAWKVQIPIQIGPFQGKTSGGSVKGGSGQSDPGISVTSGTSQKLSIAASFDGKSHVFDSEFQHYIEKSLEFARNAVHMTDQAVENLKKLSGGSLEWEIMWPALYLEGEWGWEEVEASPNADFAWRFGFRADPLFGASGTYDVLDGILLLASAHPLGALLRKVKKIIEQKIDLGVASVQAEISIPLTLSGEIAGGLSAMKRAGSDPGDFEGILEGLILCRLEGKVRGEFKTRVFFEIKAGAGAKIGAELNLVKAALTGGSDDGGIFLDGRIDGFGGKIYYATWAEGQFSLSQSRGGEKSAMQGLFAPGAGGGSATETRSQDSKLESTRELVYWKDINVMKSRRYLVKSSR